MKYTYFINKIEKTRAEFIDYIGREMTCDTIEVTEYIGMDIANYEKAKKWLKVRQDEMRRNGTHRYTIITDGARLEIIRKEEKEG